MAEELSIKIKANADKLLGELDKVKDKLDKVSDRSKIITIKTNSDAVLLDLSKVATALNILGTKSQNISITTNAKEVVNDVKEVNKELSKLGSKQEIGITLSSGDVLRRLNNINNVLMDIKSNRKINIVVGEGRSVTNISSTLKDVRNIINSINRKSLAIDGSVKVGGIGTALTQYDKIATKLAELKEKEKISINFETIGFSTAYTQLTTINNLLKQIRSNRNISSNIRVNSRTNSSNRDNNQSGGSQRNNSGVFSDSVGDITATDIVGYVGRATKGFGSLLEVVSRVLYRMQGMGGAIGEAANMTTGVVAGFTAIGAVVYSIVSAIDLIGTALINIGQGIYKVLEPGIKLSALQQAAELGISASLQTMANIDGQMLSTEQASKAAKKAVEELYEAARTTALNPKEAISAFQGVLPMALNEGFNTKQVVELTKRFGIIGKTLQLADNQLLQELRDVFQGSITPRASQIANSIGLTNADVAKYEGNAQGLYDFLMQKTQAYGKVSEQNATTLGGAYDQLTETIGLTGQKIVDAFSPAAVALMNSMSNALTNMDVAPLVDAFERLGTYIASSIDFLIAFAKDITDTEDPLDAVVNLLEDMIGFVVLATTSLITFGKGCYEVFSAMSNILLAPIAVLDTLYNSIMACVSAINGLWKAMNGDLSGMNQMNSQAEKYLNTAKEIASNGYKNTKDNNLLRGQSYGEFTKNFKALMADARAQSSSKGDNNADLAGIQGNVNKEPSKAQITASQKAMQEQIQVLKDSLADQLDVFKRAMDSIEVAFKDNAMSIGEYFKAKAENESAQNQARLDELAAEREVIQNTLYANEDDRNKALSKIDRQMSIYARNVADSAKALQEVTALQEEYTNTLASLRNGSTSNGQASTEISKATMQLDKYGTEKGVTSDITNKIVESSIKYGVDPKLAMAMMLQESGGNQNAVSPTGATGLFQLMPDTAKDLGVDATDAMQNIDGGIRYLAQKLEEFGGDVSKALASYNAGSGAVNQYNGVPPYAETQNYVNSITSMYKEMSNIPDIRPYMQDFMKEKSEGIMQAMAGGVEQGVNAGFSKWENQVMDNTTEGCVEAVTKIGDTFSKFLGDQLAKGVVNVPTLQANAKGAGIPEIPYDQSAVKPGDVVVFDGNEHVLIYKGQGKYVGNSSKLNKVTEQNASTFPMTPTSIIQTGSYGINSGITGMSLNVLTKSGLEAKNQYDKKLTEDLTNAKDYYTIFGRGDTQAKQLLILKYSKEIQKARANNDTEQIAQLQVLLADALQKVDLSFIKQDLDNRVKSLQLSAETMGYKVGLGLEDVNSAISKYYDHVNNIDSPIKAELDRLKELMSIYETRGDLKGYFEVKSAIDKVYTDLENMFKSFLQRIDDLATYRTNMIDSNFNLTTGQKAEAKQQIESARYSSEANAYQTEADRKVKDLQNKLNEYGYKSAQVQQMPDGDAKKIALSQLNDLKNEINSLQFKEIPGLKQLEEYNRQLAKIPTLMEKVHQSAKQALEDGLNTFLTDGINNAKSLSDAFNDMLTSILKSMQKVFADKITSDLMNALFPNEKEQEITDTTNKKGSYNLANSELLNYNQDTAKNSWSNFNPLESSFDLKALNPSDSGANDVTTGMTNLQQSVYTALTSVDSTLQQIVARINQSVSNINSSVSSIDSLGAPNVKTTGTDNKYDFKYTPKYAEGGIINGAGTGTSDSIHALVSNGEGIVTAQRVKQLGGNFIHAINRGDFGYIYSHLPRFATGGVVGDVGAQTTARGMTSFAKNIGTNVDASTVLNMALVKDEAEAIEHFMRSGRGQKVLVDITGANNRVINRNIRR